jgi:hypothetical protein
MKSSKETGKLNRKSRVKDPVLSKNKENMPGFSQDEIREKANDLYLQRIDRGEDGTPEDDWIEAERFLSNSER